MKSVITFDELDAEQRLALKRRMLDEELYETEGRGASYGELADADRLVTDGKLRERYEGTTFVEGDFP